VTKFAKVSSVVALLAAMLAVPVGAATINLGGGSGGLFNLGGSGGGSTTTNSQTSVDINTGNLLGGASGGDGLLDLFGDENSVASVNLGNGTGTGNVSGLVTLGGTDQDVLIDLFGLGGSDVDPTVTASIGGLLGTGGGNTNANVTIGNGGTGLLDDLFGAGAGAGGDTSTTIDLGSLGTGGLLDLFGPGADPGTGSGAGSGGPGSGSGTGGTGAGSGIGEPGTIGGTSGVRVASIDPSASAACFTPDAQQISTLLNRHSYSAETTASWGSISAVQVIEIGLCDPARAQISQMAAASGNYAMLQDFIDGQAAIRAGLSKSGHTLGDVVAVDRNGNQLIVYVI
jgi:hypothetical protein